MLHNIMTNKAIRLVMIGNSGSGKSTLAGQLAKRFNIAHLDLDTLAWLPKGSSDEEVQRAPLVESMAGINAFIHTQPNWLIEGCYSDLLEQILPMATQLVFMDLPIATCIENAKVRPWEPHKYASQEAQDAQLYMLIHWIGQYDVRQDTFSYSAHQALFARFQGEKVRITQNQQDLGFLRTLDLGVH